MPERDYLMRMIIQFVEALRRSWEQAKNDEDPLGAADLLEEAVGQATDIDGATLLSLAPESMVGILQVSGTDPRVIEYVARSLALASIYQRDAGNDALSELRLAQARALSDAYGLDLPDDPEQLACLEDVEDAQE